MSPELMANNNQMNALNVKVTYAIILSRILASSGPQKPYN